MLNVLENKTVNEEVNNSIENNIKVKNQFEPKTRVIVNYKYDPKRKYIWVREVETREDYIPILKKFERTIIKDETKVAYKLKKIDKNKIETARKSNVPCVIVKEYDDYYFSIVDKKFKALGTNIIGEHKCAHCEHISAAEDCDGGCGKVRDIDAHIEDYDFIKYGLQTINTKTPAFVVSNCSNFERFVYKTFSRVEIERRKLALAQYFFPEAKNMFEVRMLKMAQREKEAKREAEKTKEGVINLSDLIATEEDELFDIESENEADLEAAADKFAEEYDDKID